MDRQRSFKSAVKVVEDQVRLVLASGQVGGSGFIESDHDHGRSTGSEAARDWADGEPGGLGGSFPGEGGVAGVGQLVAASAGDERTALGAGGDQAGAGDVQGIRCCRRCEGGFRHDNADPRVAVDPCGFDVQRAGAEQGADFRGAQVGIVGLEQTGDGCRVRGGCRGAVERGESGYRGGNAVGSGQIRLG